MGCSQPDDHRHYPLSDQRLAVIPLCSPQSDRVCRASRAAEACREGWQSPSVRQSLFIGNWKVSIIHGYRYLVNVRNGWLSTGGKGVRRIQNCCKSEALNLSFRLFPPTQHPQWPSMSTKRGSACARSTSIALPAIISLMVSIGEMMQKA